jgi:hypothetical protein
VGTSYIISATDYFDSPPKFAPKKKYIDFASDVLISGEQLGMVFHDFIIVSVSLPCLLKQ